MEKVYEKNGLKDYKLKNMEDIKKIHGVDCEELKGYPNLTEEHKGLFKKFIVNFFNAQGLESRMSLVPKVINFVEDITYLVKESPEDEYFTEAGHVVRAIMKTGKKKILHKWIHEDYKDLEITESKPYLYLRIEYKHHGRNEWLHITNVEEWY